MYNTPKLFLKHLLPIVGERNVALQQLEPYNTDWTKTYQGRSEVVVFPTSTQHLSQLLSFCNTHQIAVVPQGGNTGLVGGQIPIQDELVLNLSKMNRILDFDNASHIVTAQAGVILQNLQTHLAQHSYQLPWDIGARGSCHIGGNIATNAGGVNVVKYGSLRNYILGLEVVLPSGEVLNLLSKNRKDNTGIDLKQLFIGSEGVLGVISAANILTVPAPQQKEALFIELDSYEQVIALMKTAKTFESLTAYEFMEGLVLVKSSQLHPSLPTPFNFREDKFYVLAEFSGQSLNLEDIYAALMQHTDRISQSQNLASYNSFWRWRETIPEILNKLGVVLKYDLSIPPEKFESFANQIFENRSEVLNVYYGHVGDGNIHYNIVFKDLEELKRQKAVIEPRVIDLVIAMGGSISAEHGVGLHKKKYLPRQKSELQLKMMTQIKDTLDPNRIMNPGKML